ncbi:MAG: serine/threonine-protein phosphatase [Actinobacteria bacterium]|nr:serine/threonine-protein phosphatase [Actinomycetota bacterium]
MKDTALRLARRELVPAYLLLAVIVADQLLGSGRSASTLVVIVPLLASTLLGPWLTAAYGVLAIVAWLVLGFVDDQFSTASSRSAQLVRIGGIVLGALIAVVAAESRQRRESLLHRVERVAEVAQRAILADLPERIGPLALAARYESSAEDATVGGDFYAAHPTPFGTRIMIGDVRGNGLDAVRLAATVLGAFWERAEEEADLSRLLERLHASVRRVAADGDFVTALVVQIDDLGVATVVNAGHVAPVLLRADVATPLLPAAIRPPLGLPGTAVPAVEMLSAGDRLLLYTDGAAEARRPADRAFRPDDAVTADALPGRSAADTVERVFAALLDWAGNRLGDDVAVVVVRYEPGTSSVTVEN